jgi:hypothetical protein
MQVDHCVEGSIQLLLLPGPQKEAKCTAPIAKLTILNNVGLSACTLPLLRVLERLCPKARNDN